jgi:hypothetical protein
MAIVNPLDIRSRVFMEAIKSFLPLLHQIVEDIIESDHPLLAIR